MNMILRYLAVVIALMIGVNSSYGQFIDKSANTGAAPHTDMPKGPEPRRGLTSEAVAVSGGSEPYVVSRFNLNNPAGVVAYGTSTNTFINSACYMDGMYYYANTSNTFGTIDPETGLMEQIASNVAFNCIEYNPVDGKMYGMKIVSGSNVLYEVNPATGSTVQVCSFSASYLIAFTITNDGRFILVDKDADRLMELNPTNGTTVSLLSVGFDINYGQDMAVDRETNTIYWAAYNANNSTAPLYIYDLESNALTLVGYFPKQYAGFATLTTNASNIVTIPQSVEMGTRPSGYWMAPETVRLRNIGLGTTVTSVSVDNHFFTVEDLPSTPFEMDLGQSINFGIGTGTGSGAQTGSLVINYDEKSLTVPLSATAYTPVAPDVWELATVVPECPYRAHVSNMHNDYSLPGDEPDGNDAVYKLHFDDDVLFSASVTSGSNPKMALYREDFEGEGGPMADNNYSGFGQLGHWTCNFEYGLDEFDWTYDNTYPWVLSEINPHEGQYCLAPGNRNIHSTTSTMSITLDIPSNTVMSFWARVSSESVSFDWGTFSIDGVEKFKIGGQGSWQQYSYNITGGSHTFTWLYRKDGSVNSYDDGLFIDEIVFFEEASKARYQIRDVFVESGTYYLVASSTSDEFSIEVEAETLPVPEVAFGPVPSANTVFYNGEGRVNIGWALGEYTNEYQLLIGETNPPTTVVVDWTSDLAESYSAVFPSNRNYYWQINERNSAGTTEGEVWQFTAIGITPSAGNILYASPEGSGLKNGSSWQNACPAIDSMMVYAAAQQIKPQIWFKEGTYMGDGVANNSAFRIYSGVNAFGSFAGTETTVEQRDIANHPTILDGQNVQRVLMQPADFADGKGSTWDGFTIRNGKLTKGNGAGVVLLKNGTLRNCVIKDNKVLASNLTQNALGGGAYVNFGTLENCEISGNMMTQDNGGSYYIWGGGAYLLEGVMRNCNIHDNSSKSSASYSMAYAGGVYAGRNTLIENCVFKGNEASYVGGAVYSYGESGNNVNITNCRFENNKAYYGGALYTEYYTDIVDGVVANNYSNSAGGGIYANSSNHIVNATIVNNAISESSYAAGIYCPNSNTVENSVVWGNRSAGINSNIGGYVTVRYTAVEGGYQGVGNISLSASNMGAGMCPKFVAPTEGAGLSYSNGNWMIQEGSALINKGTSSGLQATLPANDIAGNARIQKEVVDLGAYETSYDSDFDIHPDAHNIIYVKVDGTGDGSSWTNATPYLNLAISAASACSPKATVWVAGGTYTEQGGGTNAFFMQAGVNVYGGFAGNESYNYDLTQRDFTTNASILDGQNSQRVLYQAQDFTSSDAAVWDGFTIRNGKLTAGYGAGVYMLRYVTLRNCEVCNNTIEGGSASVYGAGIYALYSTAITNCNVHDNICTSSYNEYAKGGGIYAEYVRDITSCQVRNNTATNGDGGGLYVYGSSDYITLKDCIIQNNSALFGGGVYSYQYMTMTDCLLSNNASTNNGGGIVIMYGYARLYNNTIVRNSSATGKANGIYITSNASTGVNITNNILWGNGHANGTGQLLNNGSMTFQYNGIQDGYSGLGNIPLASENTGGMSPMFVSPTEGYGTAYVGGDWQLTDGSVCVNHGTTSNVTLPETDLAGHIRIQKNAVDMGCYESAYDAVVLLTPDANGIIYVKQDGAGNKDGSSWENATDNLQLAVGIAATANPVGQVWVAAGTYVGGGAGNVNAFTMEAGVKVYGGFAGNESADYDLALRDFETNTTILDGQHSHRVLSQVNSSTTALWDGFTIQNGGLVSGSGAGVYLYYGTLSNCIVRNNSISQPTSTCYGGGIYNYYGNVSNCEIYGNSIESSSSASLYGGGVYMDRGTIYQCHIHDNRAVSTYSYDYARAGGLYASGQQSQIINCTIENNQTSGYAGGVYADGNSSSNLLTLKNTVISGNSARTYGGAYINYTYMSNCFVNNNVASDSYGGVYAYYYNTIVSCVVNNNTALYYAGLAMYYNNKVYSSDFVNNLSTTTSTSNSYQGVGVYSSSSYNNLTNCVVWGNRKNGTASQMYGSGLSVTYSAVEGGYSGTGNVTLSGLNTGDDVHPCFASPTEGAGAEFTGGDWNLAEGSACINAGTNSPTILPSYDIAGNDRIADGTIDMGAYESNFSQAPITPDEHNIIYVVAGGAGTKDGSSWENAAASINTVVMKASVMNPTPVVWVAGGRYVGDSIAGNNAFRMQPCVNVFGGFAGNEAFDYDKSQRDFVNNATILDGQRVQRVLSQSENYTQATSATWDGFTIQNGRITSGNGAGAYLMSFGNLKNSIVRNDTIYATSSTVAGAGIYASGLSVIENVEAYGNFARNGSSSYYVYGAGIYATDGASLIQCFVHDNRTEKASGSYNSYARGGGVYFAGSGTFRDCEITGNSSGGVGGGLYVTGSSSNYISVVNTKIEGNISGYEGGGVYLNSYCRLVNCLVANNTVNDDDGAGVYATGSGTSVISSTIVNNYINSTSTSYKGAGVYAYNSGFEMWNTLVWGNKRNTTSSQFGYSSQPTAVYFCGIQGTAYAGTGNISLSVENEGEDLSPMFMAPTANVGAGYTGGDWTLKMGSAAINKGTLTGLPVTLPNLDLAGNDRVQQNKIDLGAFESPYSSLEITPDEHNIIYVTEEGAGLKNGSSWDNAAQNLNLVLSAASIMAPKPVIWVAGGTYTGDGTANTNAFTMQPGVSVYGGFAGTEAFDCDLSQRDFGANATVLDGQNSQRVLYQPADFTASTTAVWDGFVIEKGRITSSDNGGAKGAGAYIRKYGTLRNSIVRNDTVRCSSSEVYGGGIYAENTSLENCQVYGNYAHSTTSYGKVYGGGVYATNTSIDNFEIRNNYITAYYTGSSYVHGAGAYLENAATISNSVIAGNTSLGDAGGVNLYGSSNRVSMTNCIVECNTANSEGGGVNARNADIVNSIINNNTCSSYGAGINVVGSVTVTNCNIVNNSGYGFYNNGSGNVVYNTVIWGNKNNNASSNFYNNSGSISITYSAVEGGAAGGGNIQLASQNSGDGLHPMFVNPTQGVGTTYSGGDWHVMEGSALVNAGASDIALPENDLDGNVRIQNGKVDIGVYESDFTTIEIVADAHGIIYVKQGGAGTMNGSSWDNAVESLSKALTAASAMNPKPVIWVAQGTYAGDGDRYNNAFVAVAGVSVYGGFAGDEAFDYDLDLRSIESHATILDGQNKQRVLYQPNDFAASAVAVWDGFIIEKGRLTTASSGAGAYIRKNMTLRNSIVRNDTIMYNSTVYGGGIYADNAIVENVEVYGNYTRGTSSYNDSYGSGIYCANGSITSCDIHDNYGCSYYSGGSYVRGAGVYLNGTASIVGSTIRNNSNTGSGAGIYVVGTNNTNLATVTDCLIEGNNSTDDGAGIYSQYANVVNTIVRNNVSSVYGGGVYATNYSYYADCLIANNTSARNGAGVYASTSTYFTNCDIVNNLNTSTSYNGAGFYANSSNINVINSVIWGNKRSTYADNVYNASSSSYLTLTYSAVEGGWNGVGNIALDCVNEGSMLSPAFENPTEGCGANYTGGDWTVKETSILINKGAETGLYSELPLTDLAGNTRMQQDRLDIGCYESAYTASHEIHCDEHNIIYVTVEGAGLKDGSSWENATDNLNFAITEATAMEPIPVIWVAAGTYTGENAATSAFIMQPGVSVYGGFQGNEAYDFDLNLRDFDDYQTILDGQNSRRVLEQKADYSASKAVVWDGFVIERGRLNGGSGAGAYLLGNSTLRNCIIRNDTISNGSVYGAGLYLSNATLENCEVYGNYGYYNNSTNYGGGVYASNATIRNCYIHDNKVASNSTNYGMGGGIYCNSNKNTITGCVIVRNSSNKEGGGIYAYGNSSNYTNITNCRIENNTSYEGGGISGVYYFNVVGCNIANNTATYHGGGVSVSGNCTFVNTNIVNNLCTNTSSNVGSGLYLGSNGTRKLTNCIIWGNKKNQNSDQYYFSGTPTVTYCAIQGGYDGTGNITLSAENEGGELHPCFNNPTEGAGAEFSDGDWTLSMASVCINQGTTADLTLPETDLAGNERIQQGAIDMGAFESEFNAVVLTPDANHILYVSVEGAGAMDGSSWANATPYLQLAVNRAGTFQPKADVWVKEGTYVGNGVTGGNAFTIPQGIAVYGGFAGNETEFAQRDFETHVTVLDGQGVQRVLYQRTDFAATNAAVWDGFTLTNGVGEGAGAYLQANGEIRNCRVYGNGSTNSNSNGGGVRLYGSTSSGYAYMTNCYVYENNGYSGGGVYSSSGSITNCLIYGNEAQHNGGGVFVENYTSICFSTIVDNRCGNSYNGGGVYVNGSTSNSMRNTIVWGNNKGEGRNAIYNPGYIDIQYSALENGAVGLGNINLSANNTGDVMSPCFTAPENQIWTLTEGSIIINKGLDIDGITADMVGNSRVQQGTPDMGAFETGYTSGFDIVPDANGIIYVSTEGTGNGSSWANACGDLQFAINRARTMNPVPQVWVKAGIYYSEMLASSNSAFSMVAGVNVFGGFAGNESADYDLSQRDFVTHATILDGRNAQRVLYQKYNFTETTPATWDGFTIRNGYVNGNGAGVYMQAYAHLKNCIITDNATTGSGTEGGGVYSTGLSAAYNTITNCEIRNNQSVYEGGGLRMEYTTLTNSIVDGNTSTSSSGIMRPDV